MNKKTKTGLPVIENVSKKEVDRRIGPFLKWLEKPEIKAVLQRLAKK